MGRLPSGVLLVMSLSWSGLATDNCRLEDTSVSVVCIDKAMDQCRHELTDRTYPLSPVSFGSTWIQGSFKIEHAQGIQVATMNISRSGTNAKMVLLFSWNPPVTAAVNTSYALCRGDSDEDSGCRNPNYHFSFSIAKFKKISHWRVTENMTLEQQSGNPKSTIELNDHGALSNSFNGGEIDSSTRTDW